MKGNWIGKYWYSGNVPDRLKERKTEFELTIENHLNSKISGKVSDDLETGGTPGIGSFSGKIMGNRISFVKRMPVRSYFLPDGTNIEEDKPHRPIYYKGILNAKENSIKGTWRFKFGIEFLNGRLAIYPSTKGQWEMKKVIISQ